MKNPKERHLRNELNRKKICYFIDKYVTRLYGSQHITWWAAQNKNKSIFDLVSMSDSAYMVAERGNGHEVWDQLNEHQHLLGEKGQQIWGGELGATNARRRAGRAGAEGQLEGWMCV